MPLSQDILNKLIDLRHHLHANPELSGEEEKTARTIADFVNEYGKPDIFLTNVGQYTGKHTGKVSHGMAALYGKGAKGPVTLIRVDMDALPITEVNDELDYCSQNVGVAHSCGHDLHSAIGAGLGVALSNEELRGPVIILFQPDEERGLGAESIMRDDRFQKLVADLGGVDYAFALHNIPGLPLNTVACKEGVFTSAVESLIYVFKADAKADAENLWKQGEMVEYDFLGHTSHAAEPESANNPAMPLAVTIQQLSTLNARLDGACICVESLQVGDDEVHGVTAGTATVRFVVQGKSREAIDQAKSALNGILVTQINTYSHPDNQISYTTQTYPLANDAPQVADALSQALATAIPHLKAWNSTAHDDSEGFARVALTYALVRKNGSGQLNITIRTRTTRQRDQLKTGIDTVIEQALSGSPITVLPPYIAEPFSAIVNDKEAVDIVRKASQTTQTDYHHMQAVNDWGEDCGWLVLAKEAIQSPHGQFMEKLKFAFFGLGSGEQQPNLHLPTFNGPDASIEKGVELFAAMIGEVAKKTT